MKKLVTALLIFGIGFLAFSEDLIILQEDLRLEYEGNSFDNTPGYHLYIRKKPDIESVMLVETTKDPTGKEANYSYRALEYNAINGDEQRMLDGKVLQSEYAKFSLLSSTIVDYEAFGKAFHIYIPQTLQYGYPWTRNGTITVHKGFFINIRTFAKKYADYTGQFCDNPFMFDLGELPPPPTPLAEEIVPPVVEEVPPVAIVPVLTDDYNSTAALAFGDIAKDGGGSLTYSKGPKSIVDDIMASILAVNPKDDVDIVFAIDATGSMKDDIEMLRKEWVPRLIDCAKSFGNLRLGLLLYRDYGDNFNYKGLPIKFYAFTSNTTAFVKNLNAFTIKGNEGGDTPEAVYEALYASMEFFSWNKAAQKKIILIGDAQPHPVPRGKKIYTKDLVDKMSKEKEITIDAIITPDNKSERGR